jgi:hypothetical protein
MAHHSVVITAPPTCAACSDIFRRPLADRERAAAFVGIEGRDLAGAGDVSTTEERVGPHVEDGDLSGLHVLEPRRECCGSKERSDCLLRQARIAFRAAAGSEQP